MLLDSKEDAAPGHIRPPLAQEHPALGHEVWHLLERDLQHCMAADQGCPSFLPAAFLIDVLHRSRAAAASACRLDQQMSGLCLPLWHAHCCTSAHRLPTRESDLASDQLKNQVQMWD